MPLGSLFVNTSRAEIVEAGALLLAISEGRPSHAAVDVYEEEPIWSAAHPLFKFTNVLPTPHIGYVEKIHMKFIVRYHLGTPSLHCCVSL